MLGLFICQDYLYVRIVYMSGLSIEQMNDSIQMKNDVHIFDSMARISGYGSCCCFKCEDKGNNQ